ncbi:biotin--protein ligase [Thermomicrobium sp. 4228-Ro]|nr:biotin--protein ligase [Thermomicrobium sp. 4228-Ro]MCX2728481.1 biotin--protein ligase [Thermomicrobium sp. 4228-Ro]
MLHGEYKTPGGKLVQVDFELVDNRLANVRVTGDFFLEPPEALDAITRALEGAPAHAPEGELAARIAQALAALAPVELLGFSPEAVARAVRRALGS